MINEDGKTIKRGEIYLADLNPVMGSEQGGIRPVVVIQNNIGNYYSPTIIVAAITSAEKRHLPTHTKLESSCLNKDSTALLEQIRTIDKRRLISYIGEVSNIEMQEIINVLKKNIDLQ